MRPFFAFRVIAFGAVTCWAQLYKSDLPIDHPAIHYFQTPAQYLDDPVTRLIRQINAGEKKLAWRDDGLGYLPSLLENLGINTDSQALPFAKGSFQAAKISPRNPRAIYFTDDAAAGWVRGGTGVELASLDPKQGVVFYDVVRGSSGEPVFNRPQVCLNCHRGAATNGVPGMFVGSVIPSQSGEPQRLGAIITDHRTKFEDRWGGWYITAKSGEQRDRANSIAPDPAEPETLDNEGKQNLTSLARFFNPAGYLTPLSDIVALMTFEHQTQMQNLLTRLGWLVRMGADEPTLRSEAEDVAAYMLFADEEPLKDPIEGVSTFTRTFPERGPRDHKGRSLRDFDLRTRLFRYPLSYAIYSAQFDALPDAARDRLYHRLYEVLSGEDQSPRFARISAADRQAILEILRDTKPNLPGYFQHNSQGLSRAN
ncbi:MAG TPA: hypothetical protein VKX39_03610 [Bryobacteraceae bacterium]|jgi:hypothetical protein|nr:hypothetical protein [Bryobacteraceae bacterium]